KFGSSIEVLEQRRKAAAGPRNALSKTATERGIDFSCAGVQRAASAGAWRVSHDRGATCEFGRVPSSPAGTESGGGLRLRSSASLERKGWMGVFALDRRDWAAEWAPLPDRVPGVVQHRPSRDKFCVDGSMGFAEAVSLRVLARS